MGNGWIKFWSCYGVMMGSVMGLELLWGMDGLGYGAVMG